MQTLSEIPDTFRLYVFCGPCGREEAVDARAIAREHGDMEILEFRRRVRCVQCGNRTEDIRLVYVGTTGFIYRQHSGRLPLER